MKMFALSLTIFALLASNGCAKQTVYVPQEVLIPVSTPCDVEVPQCDHKKATDTGLITEARLCIKRFKVALDYCKHGIIQRNF